MPRRSKEDALATRDSILDAAELVFGRQGVSRTTLQHIASAAGVTRGAIYWHFADKAALFNAMMERATMPLESAMSADSAFDPLDPMADMRERILAAFRLTQADEKTRRVFEIATLKIEYVEELNGVRERWLANYERWLANTEKRVRAGVKSGVLQPGLQPRTVALTLWAVTDGLIRMWLLAPQSFDLVKVGRSVIDAQLDAMYLDAAPARKDRKK